MQPRLLLKALTFGYIPCTVALALAPADVGAAESPPCFVSVSGLARVPADRTYAVRLNSLTAATRDVRFIFFSNSQSFAAEATGVTTSFDGGTSVFANSKPVFVVVPTSDTLDGVAVEVVAGDKPVACLSSPLQVSDDDSTKDPFATEASRDFATAPDGAKPVILAAALRGPEPSPTCFEPHTDVRFLRVDPMHLPEAARDGRSHSVQILTIVTPDGSAAWASIYKSSGLQALDQAARVAAKSAEFAPATFRCHATTGTYLFRIDASPT
jgi:TonB family protein